MWKYILNNWVLLLISAISPIIADYLVNLLRSWRKNSWLYSLNKYLKRGVSKKSEAITSNPVFTQIIQLLLLLLFCIGLLSFIYFILEKPWDNGYWICLMLSFTSCAIMIWEHQPMKKDTKGLVGILSDKVKKVLPSRVDSSGRGDIFFATRELSYELRQPIRNEAIIRDIREQRIVTYYRELKEIINEKINNRLIDKNLFYIDGKHICDYLSEEVYSISNLMAHISLVADSMQLDNSINFIGDKIGISGYELAKGELTPKVYLSDHFTFKVFKSIFLDKKYKECFQVIIRRVNYASEVEKELLVQTLKFLFSSVGIDIVIHGRQANGKKGLLIALRNGGIERCKESKIHVPVNESFSKTDQQENSEMYDLNKCVVRGIEEELGISQDLIESKCKCVFQDFAIVCDEGEIGLACYVDLSDCMPLEQARMYPGQDKYMEIKNLLIVDMPKFHVDADLYRKLLYQKTKNDLFCENWESFTPLLFQRFFLRTRSLSNASIQTIKYLTSVAIFLYIAALCGIMPLTQPGFIVGGALTLLIGLFISVFSKSNKIPWDKTFRLFKPLVPQWGGDATVVQSTSAIIDNGLFEGMYIGCSMTASSGSMKKSLNELELIDPPYCKTRKEGTKNHTEVPISFYKMRVSDSNNHDNRLLFREVPVSYGNNDMLSVWLSVDIINNRIEYSFTKQIEAPIVEFNKTFTEAESQSLCKYFSISKDELERYRIARLTERLNQEKETNPSYRPLDLFHYQNNYYWILRPNNTKDPSARVVPVNRGTDLYSDYVVGLKEGRRFLLTGKSQDIVDALSRFISHKSNRNKITALDIYALQLALIRYEHKQNNIVLAQIEPRFSIKQLWLNMRIKSNKKSFKGIA